VLRRKFISETELEISKVAEELFKTKIEMFLHEKDEKMKLS